MYGHFLTQPRKKIQFTLILYQMILILDAELKTMKIKIKSSAL